MRYIQSELYRLKKSKPFRYLIIGSIAIILILMMILILIVQEDNISEYLELMGDSQYSHHF